MYCSVVYCRPVRLPTGEHFGKKKLPPTLDSIAILPRVLPGFFFFFFFGREVVVNGLFVIFGLRKYKKMSRIHFRSFQEENIFSCYENFPHLSKFPESHLWKTC